MFMIILQYLFKNQNEMNKNKSNHENIAQIDSGVEAVASALHERWRDGLRDNTGNIIEDFEPTSDQQWITEHGTDMVDISNTEFVDLPSDWKAENQAAARVIMDILLQNGGMIRLHDQAEFTRVGSIIHEAWLTRHEGERAELDVPFEQLPYDEQDKDIEQVQVGMQVWAKMHIAERADRGYDDETDFLIDPTTGAPISYAELLDNASAARRRAELIRQSEEPEPQAIPLTAQEVEKSADILLLDIENAVAKWGKAPETKHNRGKRYENFYYYDKYSQVYYNVLFVYDGDSVNKQRAQITYSGASHREYFVDLQFGSGASISESDYPHHEEDLGVVHKNTDLALQKASSVIYDMPGYIDPTLA